MATVALCQLRQHSSGAPSVGRRGGAAAPLSRRPPPAQRRTLAAPLAAAAAQGPSWVNDGIQARPPLQPSPGMINADLAPVGAAQRSFSAADMASLWVGLVVSVSSYFLAGGLVELGMSWKQGIACVFLGNLLVLLPMVLNGHPGTKWGIPFPVLARASFGVKGAVLPAILRGLTAAGWFGIQTWLGGAAIFQMAQTLAGPGTPLAGPALAWLGISAGELASFLLFWALQAVVLARGMEGIRVLERYSAPLLIGLTAALLAWALNAAGGLGPMLSAPSQFGPGMAKEGQFWAVFVPALSANVGYWATLSLNIPDFTRYAKSQRAQLVGQALGLPLFMAAFTFCGLAVTSTTVVLFGSAISDPIALLGKLEGVLPITLALIGLVLATLTTNIAANVVAPANALLALAPQRFTFTSAALLSSLLGLVLQPWRLIASAEGFFFKWLVGYSVILGPVAGIVSADYWLIRGRQLNLDALYTDSPDGRYFYTNGWNPAAVAALLTGAAPTLPGFLHTVLGLPVPRIFVHLYNSSWVLGFLVAGGVYCLFMRRYYALTAPPPLVA